MTRRSIVARALAALRLLGLGLGLVGLVSSMGCSTIGDPGGMPEGLPHGGTGQFRPLDEDEVGIRSPVTGRAMVLSDHALGAATPVGLDFLFYAAAPLMEEPPEFPMDFPQGEVYWPAFEPRRIHRGTPLTSDDDEEQHILSGFVRGDVVLDATEGWEGDEVFDPWPVVTDEGTARLYYAAAGGIGVAEASAIDGSFSKVDGPIVGEIDAKVPRRPSVVPGIDGGWLMYFSLDDGIRVARSDDGVSFELLDPPTFDGPDETDSPEIARIHPGAVHVVTAANRSLIRLYYVSVRADGTHLAYVGASDDGLDFELHPRPVLEATDVRFPSPLLIDDRVTFLYVNRAYSPGGFTTPRALVVTVSPAGDRFDPPEAGEPCRNHPVLGEFCGYPE